MRLEDFASGVMPGSHPKESWMRLAILICGCPGPWTKRQRNTALSETDKEPTGIGHNGALVGRHVREMNGSHQGYQGHQGHLGHLSHPLPVRNRGPMSRSSRGTALLKHANGSYRTTSI